MSRKVVVFGAGIAGLSAAHEFVRRGYRVEVYERNGSAGGFFRSARRTEDNLPTEYSWHGFGPWYHNTFDLLRQIPFDDDGTLYDRVLSRPVEYAVVPDAADDDLDVDGLFDKPRAFRMTARDTLSLGWGLLKAWSASARSRERYARTNAAVYWEPRMSPVGHATWRALFGPWIGSDWPYASLHHVGLFFGRNVRSGPRHPHPADAEGPAWAHEPGGGWSLLRGPSNEWWFDRWVADLGRRGVAFHWETPLHQLHVDGGRISGATVGAGTPVEADVYVLATTPFAAAEVVARTPELERDEQLAKFRPLVQDGPHTQVSFRIAFDERMAWPRERTAIALTDSAFNITLFANEQAWPASVDLGRGVRSLWTGTACVSTVPGPVHGKPLRTCTEDEFLDEVLAQIYASDALDLMILEANGGRGLRDFPVLRTEVWPEWHFSPDGIAPDQPKWVTTTNTRAHRPAQATSVPNLVLAGAHTETEADIWSIEGAVESGRRAARVVEPDVVVQPQHKPLLLRATARLDDALYARGLPHALHVLGAATVAGLALGFSRMRSGRAT